MSVFGNRPVSEAEREQIRRVNENLKKIEAGVYRREADAKRKDKCSELERATADEIQRGFIVLERRQFSKRFNQLMRRKELSEEEFLEAEELQGMIDKHDQELDGYGRDELTRFVRLWNKSRKARYKLTEKLAV